MRHLFSTVSLMVTAVLGLLALGIVMLSSTGAPMADTNFFAKRQLIWMAFGFVLMTAAALIDYRRWRTGGWVLYAVSIPLLLLVFVPGIGKTVNGAHRWLHAGSFTFQPSELAKLAVILCVAAWLSKNARQTKKWKTGFLVPLAILAVPALLILVEVDFGNTLLLGCLVFLMMFIAGTPLKYMLPVGGAGAAALGAMIALNPERMGRIMGFLRPEMHKEGEFYQVWMGILAFGAGGLDGLGLGNSRQKMFYLPESTTDFIFPIIGEEKGLYFTMAVLLAYVVILLCGLRISLRAPDQFGTLLGWGLVAMISIQALINIGSVTGSIPPKGFPLPFVSYGGSNLVLLMTAIGLLISIHRQSLATGQKRNMTLDDRTPSV
jgi:cell division protein FtsW